MWKRIILTGFLILKMGQINMNDLQADTSDIIKEILMCVVIAMTGMFGITGAMFTGMLYMQIRQECIYMRQLLHVLSLYV